MATNQVINGKNRITEFPNRWNLTNVGGNNYDVTQVTGEITEVGTPYGKSVLDKIDNVLSYLSPILDRKTTTITEKKYIGNVLPIDVSPTWSGSGYEIGNEITQNLTTIGTLNPKITYKTNKIFRNVSSATSGYIGVSSKISSSSAYTDSGNFRDMSKNVSYTSTKYNKFFFYNSENGNFEIIFDFGINIKPNFKYYIRTSYLQTCKIQSSDDGTNWTDEGTIVSGSSQELISNTKRRYYRLYAENDTTTSNGYIELYYLYIYELTYNVNTYQNHYLLDNNNSFTNNQRVLIDMPNDIDMNNVSTNVLNEIEIPTLLKPSTKYELIYNETTDKFEIGGLATLFDIKLEESVKQIDLSGISNMLKEGKIYLLEVNGSIQSNNNYATFGNYNNSIYMNTTNTSNMILFMPYTYENKKYIACWSTLRVNDAFVKCYTAQIEDYEYLKCSNNFNEGTRITIKEVA